MPVCMSCRAQFSDELGMCPYCGCSASIPWFNDDDNDDDDDDNEQMEFAEI